MRRVLLTAIISLLLALVFAFFGDRGEPGGSLSPAPPRSIAEHEADAGSKPGVSRSSTTARAPRPAEKRPSAIGSGGTAASSTQAASGSALDQIQAAHAIASQIDVSQYLVANAELAEKHVERMCAEAKRLPSEPFFSSGSGTADAGAFLAPRIDWATTPPLQGSLHLPDAITSVLSAEDWDDRIFEIDPMGYDVSWMRELLAYDRWELTSAGPPSTLPPGADFGSALPYYVSFMHWAKLRFARAARLGDFLDASREVRHLVDLLHDQGVVLGHMIGILILRVERRVYEALARRGISLAAGWEPFQAEDLDRLRRLDRTGYAFFLPGVSPKVMSRALECVPSPCVALTEGAWSHAAVGELSPEDTRQSFLEVLRASGCRSPLLDKLTAGQTLTLHEAHAMYEGSSPLLREYGP
ncbi:MAG: hypothetical protein U1E65_15480 [Myxococcota bacterium]